MSRLIAGAVPVDAPSRTQSLLRRPHNTLILNYLAGQERSVQMGPAKGGQAWRDPAFAGTRLDLPANGALALRRRIRWAGQRRCPETSMLDFAGWLGYRK